MGTAGITVHREPWNKGTRVLAALRMTGRHTCVHGLMPVAEMRSRDFRQAQGQAARVLAPSVLLRLSVPLGNTGIARVSVP